MNHGAMAPLGIALLLAVAFSGCATYDANVVVNPVLATTRMTIAENIDRKGSLGAQSGFVSLYATELGSRKYLAVVADPREEGEAVRVVLLEAKFEIVADSMTVTLLGDAGRSLAFVIPGAASSAGTTASESFSTLDLEFLTRQGTAVELELDLDLDADSGECTIEHARRTSDGLLGMFATREDRGELKVKLVAARAGKETEMWIGNSTPAPPKPAPAESALAAEESAAEKPAAPAKPPAKTTAPASSPTGKSPTGKKPPAPTEKKPAGKTPPGKKPPAKSPAPAKPAAPKQAPDAKKEPTKDGPALVS